MFRIINIDVVNQYFRVISDARRQINGAFTWRTYHTVNMFCDKIALLNFKSILKSPRTKLEFFRNWARKNFENGFWEFLTVASGVCWVSINYFNNNWPAICSYFNLHVFNQWKLDFYIILLAKRKWFLNVKYYASRFGFAVTMKKCVAM